MATTLTEIRDSLPDGGNNRSLLRDYVQLAKPRIVTLLIFTTLTAMVVAAQGQPLPTLLVVATLLGGAAASAGASALNQYIDRDMDKQMARTRNRPIPSGRIAPSHALIYGIALSILSMLILVIFVNPLAAFLSGIGIVYYVILYTVLLKRNTVLNILIGGGAGAMPVLVGWAAATNALAPGAWILFAIVFYWTPPHSWALALLVNKDYAEANVPMMPVARGQEVTRIQILLYSVQLIALSLLPIPFRISGGFYLVCAVLLGIGMIWQAWRLIQLKTGAQARKTYKYSTFYLALLFLALIIDQLV